MITDPAPRETDELWPFEAEVDGLVVTSGVKTCVTTGKVRPTSWTPAVIRDGRTLLRIASLDRGAYHAWAQVTRDDEVAVIYLGPIYLD